MNGDGYADVIIGSSLYHNPEADEGMALVYYGNAGGGLAMRPRQLRTDGATPIALLGLSNSSTAVQLRLNRRMPLGQGNH